MQVVMWRLLFCPKVGGNCPPAPVHLCPGPIVQYTRALTTYKGGSYGKTALCFVIQEKILVKSTKEINKTLKFPRLIDLEISIEKIKNKFL